MVIAAWLAGTTAAAAQAGTAALSGTIKDEQGGALPGVTVTATNAAGLVRSTSTDATGTYHLLALPPGAYDVKAELSGFRTAVREKLPLPVDVTTRFDVQMAIGALTETISVHGEVNPINVTDASLGNVISGEQVRALPLEANNVNGLLSLQPGAVYVPNAQVSDSRTGAVLNIDPRSGAVSGARADQSNITLDGIDVNDPQFGTAYASALRMTLDSLQEFRVSTSNYGAEAGRSSGPQVSLVTRSGTNDFHGSGKLGAARHALFEQRLLPEAVAARTRRSQQGAQAGQEDLRRVLRRARSPGTSCSSSATTSGSTRTARRRCCATSRR